MTENNPTFTAAYDGYLLAQQARHLSKNYQSLLSRSRDYWVTRHGDQPLREYTADHIRQWLVWLAGEDSAVDWPGDRPMSGASVDVHYRNLKAFYLWCEKEGILEFGSAPIRKVPRPKAKEKIPDALTGDEVKALLKAVRTNAADPNAYRNYAILLFFADTGVRLEELEGLTLDSVNLQQGYAKVTGKGDKERLVKLGLELCRALSKYRLQYRKQSASETALFTNDAGFKFERAGIRTMVVRALHAHVKRHLAKYGPHTLRHTYATLDLLENGDIKATSLQMGHTTTGTTERYLHLAGVMRAGRSPMDAVLGK